jgi:hypothetical protein
MTTEQRIEKLERRLEIMKRRNRWLVTAVLTVAAVWGVWACFGEPAFAANSRIVLESNKTVRAGRFVVVDDHGQVRGMFGMSRDKGGPEMILYDENGVNRARIFVYKGVPCVSLDGSEGKPRAGLYESGEKCGMFLNDEKGKARVILSSLMEGPVLNMNDEHGRVRASMSVPDEGPRMIMLDELGKARARMFYGRDVSGINLYDEKDKPVWKAP